MHLELRLLVLDRHAEELFLEAGEGHREVDERDEGGHVGRQVGEEVGVARREEEAEAVGVVDVLVAHLDDEARPLAREVATQQGHEDRLDRVDLLEHESLAEAHAELERVGEARLVRDERLDAPTPRLQVGLEPLGRLI